MKVFISSVAVLDEAGGGGGWVHWWGRVHVYTVQAVFAFM